MKAVQGPPKAFRQAPNTASSRDNMPALLRGNIGPILIHEEA